MPALTHGRVKNGHNGHSSKCGVEGQPCGGQGYNPLDKGKTYRCVAPPKTGVAKKQRCPSNIGASAATKRAWFRRAFSRCPSETASERAKRLALGISNGKDIATLFNEGFRSNDYIENFGFLGAADYVFRNATNAQSMLNNIGISNTAILSAGVVDNGTAGYDFSNFSSQDLLTNNPRVRLTQLGVALGDTAGRNHGQNTESLSPDAKLKAGIEIGNLYSNLSDYQKTNIEDFVTAVNPSYAGLVASGLYSFIYALIL